MKEVVIVSACRTAIGTFGGTLKNVSAEKIACATMEEAIKRAGIDPGMIDDVRIGCCAEPTDALNVARVSSLMIGVPDHVPAVTVNRVCISAMEAVVSGMAMIQANMAGLFHRASVFWQVRKGNLGLYPADIYLDGAGIYSVSISFVRLVITR